MCQIREKRLQDCKVVSAQRHFAPRGVWGTWLCCRAAWRLLPHMTWCTTLIPHHIISHYFSYPQTLTNTKRYASPHFYFLFSFTSPHFFFLQLHLCFPSAAYWGLPRYSIPSSFFKLQVWPIQKRNLNVEFYWVLNIVPFSCSVVSIWNSGLDNWRGLKRSGSLGWLHAILYIFSNPHQSSLIYALSFPNYDSEVRPAESLSLSSFPLKSWQEGK